MADNTITIEFRPCEPTPAAGYLIRYRPVSGGAYRERHVFSSPATWVDHSDPVGTSYEGFINGDCGNGQLGVDIPWTAPFEGSQEASPSASASASSSEGDGSIDNARWMLVNVTAASTTVVFMRAKILFDAYPGADHYGLEWSTTPNPIFPFLPPVSGWTPYTAQPTVPADTYLNASEDGVGPSGISNLVTTSSNEPWVRLRAYDASNVVIGEMVFFMPTGNSVNPDVANIAYIQDEDLGDGTFRYSYPGDAIAIGYKYYRSFDTSTETVAVAPGDTKTQVLQKFADLFSMGITVVGTSFIIASEFFGGTARAHQ